MLCAVNCSYNTGSENAFFDGTARNDNISLTKNAHDLHFIRGEKRSGFETKMKLLSG